MSVFVVMYWGSYDRGEIQAIFSTSELAKKFIEENYSERQIMEEDVSVLRYLLDSEV